MYTRYTSRRCQEYENLLQWKFYGNTPPLSPPARNRKQAAGSGWSVHGMSGRFLLYIYTRTPLLVGGAENDCRDTYRPRAGVLDYVDFCFVWLLAGREHHLCTAGGELMHAAPFDARGGAPSPFRWHPGCSALAVSRISYVV